MRMFALVVLGALVGGCGHTYTPPPRVLTAEEAQAQREAEEKRNAAIRELVRDYQRRRYGDPCCQRPVQIVAPDTRQTTNPITCVDLGAGVMQCQ